MFFILALHISSKFRACGSAILLPVGNILGSRWFGLALNNLLLLRVGKKLCAVRSIAQAKSSVNHEAFDPLDYHTAFHLVGGFL